MSSRMAIGLSSLVLLLGANLFLMNQEDFVVKSAEELKVIDDPLAAMRYQGNRDQNLRSIGVPPSLRDATLKIATRVDRRDGDRLARRMQNSERREQLAEDLCGQGELPRRYMLLELLVVEQDGRRQVLAPGQVQFEPMGWFQSALVEELHDELERVQGGARDVSARIVAAALAGKELDLLNSQGIWSANGWSWESLLASEPSLVDKIPAFLGTGLVLLERAQGALCGAR